MKNQLKLGLLILASDFAAHVELAALRREIGFQSVSIPDASNGKGKMETGLEQSVICLSVGGGAVES